jgi:hypothetical protein
VFAAGFVFGLIGLAVWRAVAADENAAILPQFGNLLQA